MTTRRQRAVDIQPEEQLGPPLPAQRRSELQARLDYINWAAATRFGLVPAPGFPQLTLLPPRVDPDQARGLYRQACDDIDHAAATTTSPATTAPTVRSALWKRLELAIYDLGLTHDLARELASAVIHLERRKLETLLRAIEDRPDLNNTPEDSDLDESPDFEQLTLWT